MEYDYTFDVWPDETWNHPRALYDYWRLGRHRVIMRFTEERFERFRSDMGHAGFTIRGITRVPYTKPEPIY